MEPRAEADAAALVRAEANAVADLIGAALDNWETVTAPCQGRGGEIATDGRWNLSGHAQTPLAPERHLASLERIRAEWQRRGYRVTTFRTFPPDGATGQVAAITQPDQLSISVSSGMPPTALTLLIVTPCYRPAAGEGGR